MPSCSWLVKQNTPLISKSLTPQPSSPLSQQSQVHWKVLPPQPEKGLFGNSEPGFYSGNVPSSSNVSWFCVGKPPDKVSGWIQQCVHSLHHHNDLTTVCYNLKVQNTHNHGVHTVLLHLFNHISVYKMGCSKRGSHETAIQCQTGLFGSQCLACLPLSQKKS